MQMQKIFTFKNMMVILIIIGITFIISGIITYVDHTSDLNRLGSASNPVFNYSNEIEGASYIIMGTAFIITGLCLIVRLKEKP